MHDAVANAQDARRASDAAPQSLIITGDERQASYWRQRSKLSLGQTHSVIVERGNRGNFLGTLQAYAAHFGARARAIGDSAPLQQIVMLVGAGTRLSPFTQALGNMKSAFPLPDADQHHAGLCVGEAAIRSTSPWIGCLERGGFDGLVIRWGDEVQIPSVRLRANPGQFEGLDAIRFGWRTDPNEQLASQKEWLLADARGHVVKDISRQPLESLIHEFAAVSSPSPLVPYVNLGSLAASHRLLQRSCEVFERDISDISAAANWDPYFWIALQCESREDWEAVKAKEAETGRSGIAKLTAALPHFFGQVQRVKQMLQDEAGREVRVGVLDFGQPYWLDAGSHFALRRMFSDIFSSTEDGNIIRSFLGLPHSVAYGESFVKDSRIVRGVQIRNSIVIGSEISDSASTLDGAIVLGGRFGRLHISRGGVALYSNCDELTVDGPHGIAFRLLGNHVVSGRESASTLISDDSRLTMRYDDTVGSINDDTYSRTLLENPASYREAAAIMNTVDPAWLDRYWTLG